MLNRRSLLKCVGGAALTAQCYPKGVFARSLFESQSRPFPELLSGYHRIKDAKDFMIGYPINMVTPSSDFFTWRRELFEAGIDQFAFNNVGSPYKHSHIPFNSHSLEKELIRRFAKIYGFKQEAHWGFLSNSGTDSNMQGLYMGRTILESKAGVLPKLYYTKEAHYSIQILKDLLGFEGVVVDTLKGGSMDTKHLEELVGYHSNNPVLVVATIGTTFKGAVDSVDQIQKVLRGRVSYLHLDAALFGGYLPHTKFSDDLAVESTDGSGGRKRRYDSLAVSCHKFFGFPSPAGLFITTKDNFECFHKRFSEVHDPEYLLQVPGTISCSRDGVKPSEFYFFSSQDAFAKQAIDAADMLDNCSYLLKEMNSHLAESRPVRADDRSNTVYFRRPNKAIVQKYSLATMTLDEGGRKVPYAHVVVMPHVTKPIIDRFLSDLAMFDLRD